MQTIRQLPLRALRFETGVLMRKETHERKTSETNISISLDIDGMEQAWQNGFAAYM